MSRLEKLIEVIRARPPEARFEDVRKLLEAFGREMKRQSGSHVSFKKRGERSITVPLVSGRKVKRTYLDQLCELLEGVMDFPRPTIRPSGITVTPSSQADTIKLSRQR